jgi:flagellar motility protein MotE (MotC chaperone)
MKAAARWTAGTILFGALLGLGVSVAVGAQDGSLDPSQRPSPETGREQILALLERKERALERREATVAAREADLRAAEEQLQKRLAELQSLRDEVRKDLVTLDEDREKRVVHLVKMFESMRAPQAAAILAVTEDAIALEVLERMNRSKAGKVLAAMPPDRASALAEQIGDAALTAELP